MLVVELQPLEGVEEGLVVSYIVNDNAAARVLEIAGDETFESLLSRSVPKLDAIVFVSI